MALTAPSPLNISITSILLLFQIIRVYLYALFKLMSFARALLPPSHDSTASPAVDRMSLQLLVSSPPFSPRFSSFVFVVFIVEVSTNVALSLETTFPSGKGSLPGIWLCSAPSSTSQLPGSQQGPASLHPTVVGSPRRASAH